MYVNVYNKWCTSNSQCALTDAQLAPCAAEESGMNSFCMMSYGIEFIPSRISLWPA